VRGIPRDTWNMFLNFTTVVGNNLSQYDDTEAWPRSLSCYHRINLHSKFPAFSTTSWSLRTIN
jgi:hypothetical protein